MSASRVCLTEYLAAQKVVERNERCILYLVQTALTRVQHAFPLLVQFSRSQNMGGVFTLPMCTGTTYARDRSLDSVREGLVHLNLTAVSCADIQ